MKKSNGEGSIYYSEKKKLWIGQICTGRDANGKLIRVTKYGKTKKEVHDKLVQVEVAPKIKGSATFGELAIKILHEKVNANLLKPVSETRTREVLKIIEKHYIWDMDLSKIEDDDINNFLSTVTNYSNSVISKIMIQLKLVFGTAFNKSLITQEPMFSIRKPKSDKQSSKVEAFTIEEQQAFIKQCEDEYYKDLFMVLLYTGMRIGEALALTIDDIDFEKNVIHITKTITRDKKDRYIIGDTTKTYNSMRDIPITSLNKPFLLSAIDNYSTNDLKLIFATKKRVTRPPQINYQFKRICKDANIMFTTYESSRTKNGKEVTINNKSSDAHTHMLRHTYATRCIEAGISASVLAKLLGHKDIKTTLNTYTSVFNRFQNEELKKLENYLGCST